MSHWFAHFPIIFQPCPSAPGEPHDPTTRREETSRYCQRQASRVTGCKQQTMGYLGDMKYYHITYLYNSYHAQNIESTFDIFWSWIFNGETGILPSKHQHKWPNWISFWPSGSTTKKGEFCFYQHCSGSQQGLRLKNSIPVMLQLFVATLRIGTCVLQCRFFFSAFLHKQGTSAVIAVLFWNQSTKLPWRNVRFQFTFLVNYKWSELTWECILADFSTQL